MLAWMCYQATAPEARHQDRLWVTWAPPANNKAQHFSPLFDSILLSTFLNHSILMTLMANGNFFLLLYVITFFFFNLEKKL